ncbi:hypothetical protein MKK84_19500 [Methylobacterium sp. E-065]|uniref:hypothetical protein n=1 Tax=Methylobacterium sp. E-065 TaxID=2836583 RepID=UPI001FB916B4|nr:hypothetical protein [Methylobacterium sp. E-065]MCJ2019592.1 hypothetical protein [Methylobacterium sp. E-065]
MTAKIKDLGVWNIYVPDPIPEWASEPVTGARVAFSRREGDGVDWYEFRKAESSFSDGYLLAITSGSLYPVETIQGVFRDRNATPVPFGMRVLEIEDIDHDDPTPWKAYEQRIYDPGTQAIGGYVQPPVLSVRDYQFAGQAAAEGIIGDDDALEWITVGKTPDRLISAVKEKVTDPDRQKRVLLFLAGTTTFPRFHELTPLLAGSFGKDTPEKVDAFFLAASQR